MDQENLVIIAMGAAVKMPILVPGMDPNFTNKGGAVMNTREPVAKQGQANAKTPKITNVKWSKTEACLGEDLELEARLQDQYESAAVYFTVWDSKADRENAAPIKKITAQNKGGTAKAKTKFFLPYDKNKTEYDDFDPVFTMRGIQQRLKVMGNYGGIIDGEYGEKTIEGIKKFQQSKNIDADGIPGRDTLDKLQDEFEKNYLQKDEEKEVVAEYIFTAISYKCQERESEKLSLKHKFIEIELIDDDGFPVPKEEFILTFSDGIVKKGFLNKEGKIKIRVENDLEYKIEYPKLDEEAWEKNDK